MAVINMEKFFMIQYRKIDKLQFIKTAIAMKENGYSMHLHKRSIYQKEEFTIYWSLMSQEANEVVILISNRKQPSDDQKERIPSYYILENGGVNTRFCNVIDMHFEG